MAMSSKAVLAVEPKGRPYSDGYLEGIWSRKTVTAFWDGHVVTLKTDREAGGKTRCAIIRAGKDFLVARLPGKP